ncbi:MAG: hypothetical protein JJU34_08560 [Lunatimonas sp.]|uniref:hypothetical protein n=1 Tax=Lunatimonas sp. TaxID=2060141 RepID=UPI00263B33C1|nr:hypothetical protein [Lunatimonas sp.]MCC5937319.1 hypothetical protein [Lunatimonas sp.]
MKKIYMLAFSLMLLTSMSFGDVLRVNNQLVTNPLQKVFASLQEAHDFASVGDTLMVEPSPVIYGRLNLSKRLVLIGTGYFLDENPNVPNNGVSRVGQIDLLASSSGTFLIGLVFSNTSTVHTPMIMNANNIVIMRCHLSRSIILSNSSVINSLTIINNYFAQGGLVIGATNVGFTGVVFNNNIVNGVFDPGLTNSFYQRVFSSIENNIFLSGVVVDASRFRSNIIASNTTNVTVNSNDIQNNLSLANQLSTGTGNQLYAAAQLFEGPENNSTDSQYRLKSDSPYRTAGFGGSEPGIFGGSNPYVLSGIPPVPTIYEFAADSFGSKEGGLTIQLKAKSNL